jgi:nucleoside 2-deoxyribosyltransferase
MSSAGRIIQVFDALPLAGEGLVYLAGPVPRESAEPAWHDEAIEECRKAGFEGTIAVPRLHAGTDEDPDAQIAWEHAAMSRADALLFWIPRVLWELPGLTSNFEWGVWHDSGKAVLGAPAGTPRMRYLRFYAQRAGAPQAESLAETARLAVRIATA